MHSYLKFLSGIIAMTSVMASSLSAVEIPANSPEIVYTGRISWQNPESPAFSYPGVSAALNFQGTSVAMKTKPGSGYFMVEIDDFAPFKINFAENDSIIVLAEGLTNGRHSLKVIYAVEGLYKRPEFRGFSIPDGKLLKAPNSSKRKIEFIGNSITCGYGIEAESQKERFSLATENHYYSFAAQTARALKADYQTVARSGIGIYRNYGGPQGGTPDVCLPAIYNRTLFYDATQNWDFSRFTPDVVCVNLGTNDMSLNRFNEKLLESAYRNFIARLRTLYPKAQIVMLTGSMQAGKNLDTLKSILDKIAEDATESGDKQIYRFDMSPQNGTLGYGADYHPSRRQANKMALELTKFLRGITGWR